MIDSKNDHDEDRELMLLIAKRDVRAYKKLLTKHLAKCTRFAERIVGDHSDAKDIMQELCLKIWSKPESWQPTAPFTTWLYRVLFNACIDYKRKRRLHTDIELDDVEDTSLSQDNVMIEQQKYSAVRNAMQKLPERQRAALALCYYDDIPDLQAAQILGINLGALQQLLFRARQNLKEMLTAPVGIAEKKR